MTPPAEPANPVPFVWHPRTRRHLPGAEIWLGVRTPGTEVVERVNVIREALIRAGHPEVTAGDPAPDALLAVHDHGMIEHLRSIHDAWVVGGYADDPGQDRVVPYVFPTAGMLGGLPVRRPTATHARAGQYCYDTMTLIGPGTWDAVEASAGAALTAADIVADAAWVSSPAGDTGPGSRTPAPLAYALSRPPGHHAARAAFGGSCYLNNAAIAAERLRERGARRVAILDIDAHHGNGTQAIFYHRGDVFYGSVHVDPGAGWFPHFLGFADEAGLGAGEGTNRNIPLPARSGDDRWLTAVEELMRTTRQPSEPMPWWCPWESTARSTIRRAPCASPATDCGHRDPARRHGPADGGRPGGRLPPAVAGHAGDRDSRGPDRGRGTRRPLTAPHRRGTPAQHGTARPTASRIAGSTGQRTWLNQLMGQPSWMDRRDRWAGR